MVRETMKNASSLFQQKSYKLFQADSKASQKTLQSVLSRAFTLNTASSSVAEIPPAGILVMVAGSMSQILAGKDCWVTWVTLGEEYERLNAAACDVGDDDDVTTASDDLLKHTT